MAVSEQGAYNSLSQAVGLSRVLEGSTPSRPPCQRATNSLALERLGGSLAVIQQRITTTATIMNTQDLRDCETDEAVRKILDHAVYPVHEKVLSAITREPVHEIRNVLTPMVIEGEVEQLEDERYVMA